MLGINKVKVADNERVLVYRNKNLNRVLTAGQYWITSLIDQVLVERYDITDIKFEHSKNKYLMSQYAEKLSKVIEVVETSDQEVALVYVDNKLSEVLKTGSYATYWKTNQTLRIEKFDLTEGKQVSKKVISLMQGNAKLGLAKKLQDAIYLAQVGTQEKGLLTINGKVMQILDTGTYGYWRYNQNVAVKIMDMKLQGIEVSGQEILTKDRVSLRINLSANYQVDDAMTVVTKVNDVMDFVYKTMQLALRESVGTKTLDELLANKSALNDVIETDIQNVVKEYGVIVKNVGLKDIILPGEMKEILNQVVQAQKAAEANLIKRREETAATRSLYNTAKMMENNATLMRLKELETLEKVTQKIDKINVYDGLNGVLNGLVSISDKTN